MTATDSFEKHMASVLRSRTVDGEVEAAILEAKLHLEDLLPYLPRDRDGRAEHMAGFVTAVMHISDMIEQLGGKNSDTDWAIHAAATLGLAALGESE